MTIVSRRRRASATPSRRVATMTKTITVEDAKNALARWDGMLEVTVQIISGSGVSGYSFDSIEEAVAEYNDSIRKCSKSRFGCYMVTLSKTWPEDPDDEDSCWESEPVFLELV